MVNVDIYLNANTCVQSLKNQAIKGAGVIVAARISTYCIQMIGTVILARMLVPEDFGLVTMVTVFYLDFNRIWNSWIKRSNYSKRVHKSRSGKHAILDQCYPMCVCDYFFHNYITITGFLL